MTLDQMRAEVIRRLAEVGPVFWTSAEIDTAINDGYLELSDASEWYETFADVALLNNRPYYDARAALPATLLGVGPAFNRQTNQWLRPTSVRTLDAHDRRWETVTGQPQRILTRGLWWLGYWPRVQADSGTVRQWYTALPDPLSDPSDEPGFPESYHYGCVEFALTDLWAQDGETQRALTMWARYLETEQQLVAWVAERAGGPQVHGFGAGGAFIR